ncbi:hypothetical protein [Pseudomonas fluorescens]|uniref:Delta-60 repeat domain-containing protein n=1 Tax=Pseudomonas fluorescens TaxID=294 RepID=A0A423LSM4_PSEFL|nr:hypothetical protein [Pseudomonas fluorescens]RON71305.1 hypothetical protein BK671_03830 [Pseudomonas fluorescens]
MATQDLTEEVPYDLTFANKGVAIIDIAGGAFLTSITTVGSGPDFRIYFSGYTQSDPPQYVLGRLHEDGSRDAAFGDNGLVVGGFPEQIVSGPFALLIQPDGKIITYGATTSNRPICCFARFNSNGSLDRSFATDGYALIEYNLTASSPAVNQLATGNSDAAALDAQLLPDGDILAFATGRSGNQILAVILRLTPDGVLDTAFNKNGYVQIAHHDPSYARTSINSLSVQPDGTYLCCGRAWGEKPNVGLFVRLHTDGTRVKTFGDNGLVTVLVPPETGGMMFEDMAMQPNQRTLAVGWTHNAPTKGLMYSIEYNGEPNIQFHSGKPLLITFEENKNSYLSACAIQKNGRIVVVGSVEKNPQQHNIVIARYVDATPDPTFNNGKGRVEIDLSGGNDIANGVALQDNGKILVCGSTDGKPVVFRLLA